MKKFSIALIALAMALAITPAALADNFTFGYTTTASDGSGNSGPYIVQGTLTGNLAGVNLWEITSGSITLTGATDFMINGVSPVLGSGTLVTNPAFPGSSNDGLFIWDDALNSPPGFGHPFVNNNGLLFKLTDGTEVNIFSILNFAGPGTDGYMLDEWGGGVSGLYQEFGEMNLTHLTPEPGSLFLLGTGLLGLALVLFRKAKPAQGMTLSM